MSIQAVLILATVAGVGTMYTAEQHQGNPLWCDRWDNDLSYRDDLSFVAIPPSYYENGWQCGDLLIVDFGDKKLVTYALDSGFLDNKYVMIDGKLVPIVVDVPEHLFPFDGTSHRATVKNISLANRMLLDAKIGYLLH